jgi:hypothetical protein
LSLTAQEATFAYQTTLHNHYHEETFQW